MKGIELRIRGVFDRDDYEVGDYMCHFFEDDSNVREAIQSFVSNLSFNNMGWLSLAGCFVSASRFHISLCDAKVLSYTFWKAVSDDLVPYEKWPQLAQIIVQNYDKEISHD